MAGTWVFSGLSRRALFALRGGSQDVGRRPYEERPARSEVETLLSGQRLVKSRRLR